MIRYTKLRMLGRGAQGEVHKIVDRYTGAHYACKIIAVKEHLPELRIFLEKEFRAKIEEEVKLVGQAEHVSFLFNSI